MSVKLTRKQQIELRDEVWRMFVAWHPDEAAHYAIEPGAVNPECEMSDGLVIRITIAPRWVGVWLKLRDDADAEALSAKLEPRRESLARRLGSKFGSISNKGFLENRLANDWLDKSNWPEAVEWLAERSRAYRHALTEALGEPA